MRSSLNINLSFNCLTLSLWGYWKVRCCEPPRVPLKALILSPLSVDLTCMVMRRDHQWLTPGPTANCIGDAHTHNQVLLRIPYCQVGPGPFHYQFTLQPRKAPIPPESEEKASNGGRWAEKGLPGPLQRYHIPAPSGGSGLSRTQTRLSPWNAEVGDGRELGCGEKGLIYALPPVCEGMCFLLYIQSSQWMQP